MRHAQKFRIGQGCCSGPALARIWWARDPPNPTESGAKWQQKMRYIFQRPQSAPDHLLHRTTVERRSDHERWEAMNSFSSDRLEQKVEELLAWNLLCIYRVIRQWFDQRNTEQTPRNELHRNSEIPDFIPQPLSNNAQRPPGSKALGDGTQNQDIEDSHKFGTRRISLRSLILQVKKVNFFCKDSLVHSRSTSRRRSRSSVM